MSEIVPAARLSKVTSVPVILSVSAACASVERPEIGRSEVERIVSFAEVDCDTGSGAPRRERHSISAGHGQDVAAAHGAHNSDTIRRCGSRIASGSVSFDSIHSRSTGDRAPGINRNTRSGGSASPNTGTARARDRGGCDSRRSTTRVGGRDARDSSFDRSGSGDTEVASRGAVEFRKDAGLSGSGDRSGSDTDRAHSGSRISGKDTSAVSDHGPTRAVDGDTGVGAIGVRTYPAIVGAGSGDSADCVDRRSRR